MRLPAGRIHLVLQSLVRYKYCVKTKEETDTKYSHDINHRPDGKGIFKTKVAPKNYQNHQPFIITHQLAHTAGKKRKQWFKKASEPIQNPDLFFRWSLLQSKTQYYCRSQHLVDCCVEMYQHCLPIACCGHLGGRGYREEKANTLPPIDCQQMLKAKNLLQCVCYGGGGGFTC